jgi:transposase
MPKISRLEVIETGARRRWTPEEKQRIVAESFGAPRVVSATARRNGLSNSQLFTWRRLAREGKLVVEDDAAAFVPAVVAAEHGMADEPPEPRPESSPLQTGRKARAAGRMEIVLFGARRVIVGSDVDAAALMRVIDVLERRPVCRSLGEGR